ncbi:MAG: NYN domain-containing protein [candidate division SR1 bacterium]|nr:NYN domain-containing protein [candidate division SR1 bacterium]
MEKNFAFIDGQNLHLGLKADGRELDLKRFKVFLADKFHTEEVYYFLGFISEKEQELYSSLQKAGFIVLFREHSPALKGKKKGNVDVDIVFEIMKKIIEKEEFDKVVLVSGDGDYIKLVKYLIEKGRFKKILFPNRKYSSLYDGIRVTYGMTLGVPDIRQNLEYKKKGKFKKQAKKKKVS